MSPNVAADRTSKREIAAMLRALGESQDAAARQAGISKRTLQRWERDDKTYWERFEAAKRQVLRVTWGEAWHVARQSLRDDDSNVRLRAALGLIDAVSKDYPQRHEISGPGGGPIEERRIRIVKPVLVDEEPSPS